MRSPCVAPWGCWVVPGDADATARTIMGAPWLLRSGVIGHLGAEIILLCLALTLYQLLRPVNESHALLMFALVVVSVPIGFVSEIFRLAALQWLSGAGCLAPLTSAELHAQAMARVGRLAHLAATYEPREVPDHERGATGLHRGV